MMENRSFDHMLGYLYADDPRIDGLKGNESNPYSTTKNSKIQLVNQDGYDTGPDDPGHSWDDTTEEIFGYHLPPTQKGVQKMNGFVQNALSHGHTPYNPLSMFTKKTAPIINTLAKDFAVFDRWFCSLPGPTDPNRSFLMSGTSNGAIDNFNGTLWGQQSYFDFLRKHGVTWKAYYQDDPWAIMYFQDMHLPENNQYVNTMDQFFEDVQKGSLHQFSLLQPRMTTHKAPPTWQHPDASVTEGESLYKSIYENLRTSAYWNEMAFILTYDEHGGFYDHVPPPQTDVPSPDGVPARNGFRFDRQGIRVPTVVVSPWVPAGTVVHEPQGPLPSSQYDTTSIMATANKIFGITDHLSARAAWSGTFEGIFTTLDKPRDDCPVTLPDVAASDPTAWAKLQASPLNEHLEIQVAFYCKFNGHGDECGKDIKTQYDASVFIEKEAEYFMSHLPKMGMSHVLEDQ